MATVSLRLVLLVGDVRELWPFSGGFSCVFIYRSEPPAARALPAVLAPLPLALLTDPTLSSLALHFPAFLTALMYPFFCSFAVLPDQAQL